MRNYLRNNSGFSIIEVLIGAVVFMVGFSLLIGMLSNVFVKFSTKEMKQATNIANEQMIYALHTKNINNTDSVVVKSGISFTMKKTVEFDNSLAKVTISVTRTKTNKEIIKLYNEFILPKEQ